MAVEKRGAFSFFLFFFLGNLNALVYLAFNS